MSPKQCANPLSVVMPVHNALPFLDAAIQSITEQSFADFEFIIFDDSSTDGSSERLRAWSQRDSRIRIFEQQPNLGPAASSNRIVEIANAPLIARMDADDVAHPDRLRHQIGLLQSRAEIGVVGTSYETIDAEGRSLRGPNLWRLFHTSWFVPFAHGSVMFRREIFDRLGGYREECVFWEDQDFFLRASAITTIVTIVEPLYRHRHSPASTRLASDQHRVEAAVDLAYRCIGRLKEGKDYGDLLLRPRQAQRVDPRVFISLGSLVLWAGKRPRLVRRLLDRGKLSFDLTTFNALVWTIWAALSPSTLRGFLRSIASVRNALVSREKLRQPFVEWRTPRALPSPEERYFQSRPTIASTSAKR